MAVGLGILPNATWTVTDKGSWTANGITGEGEEFASYGTNLCIADTTPQSGGYSTPSLQSCGANGTVWVACSNGDGYFLYDRFFLNQGGGSDNVDQLGVALSSGQRVLQMVNENYASAAWFIRWQFPIPGPTPPACS